jgi:hypothetical protein
MLGLKTAAGETLRTLTGEETTPGFPRQPAVQSISPLSDPGLPQLPPRKPPWEIERKREGLAEGAPPSSDPISPHPDASIGIRLGDSQKKDLLLDTHPRVIGIRHEEVDAEQHVLGIKHDAPNPTHTDLDTSLGIRRGAPHDPRTDRHSLVIGIRPEGVEQTLGNQRPASSSAALGIRRQSPVADAPLLPIGFESMFELPLDVTNVNSPEAPPPASNRSNSDAPTGVSNPLSPAEISRSNSMMPTDPTISEADQTLT